MSISARPSEGSARIPPLGGIREAEAAPPPPLLHADDLHFAYPGSVPLIEGLSLAVAAREVVVLLGGSGCGKSTLLRLLAGLETARRGQVRHGGAVLARPHPDAALLFQQPSLLPWLRVRGNVGFGLDFEHQPRLSEAERLARVDDALQAVGLPHAGSLWPRQLSGGMAQRVALARALARQPALLLADEPFSALDAITRGQMQSLLLQVVARRGAAVLLVTHDLDEALVLADRVLLLGRPAADGAVRGHAVVRSWTLPSRDDETARLSLRRELHAALLDTLAGTVYPTPLETSR